MIKCTNLTSLYGSSQRGLANFNTDINDGKVYGLLGKNGAGKTTLIRMLMGILFPQKGSCEVHGFPAKERNPKMLEDIGLVPEEYFLPPVSPETYIRYWSKFYPKFNHSLIEELLEKWKFPASDLLGRLSQGEKKKFVIAFTLATNASLLLLDEPTNGLDITSKMIFRSIIHQYQKEEKTIIISTHQIKDIDELLEAIIIVDDGEHLGTFDRSLINEKFELSVEKTAGTDAIFAIDGMEGKWVLKASQPGKTNPKPIDLELFFTAFLEEKDKILARLNS